MAELCNLTRLVSEKSKSEFVFADRLNLHYLAGDTICATQIGETDFNFWNWQIRILADQINHPCNLLCRSSRHQSTKEPFRALICSLFPVPFIRPFLAIFDDCALERRTTRSLPHPWTSDPWRPLCCVLFCHVSDHLGPQWRRLKYYPTDSPLTVFGDSSFGRRGSQNLC